MLNSKSHGHGVIPETKNGVYSKNDECYGQVQQKEYAKKYKNKDITFFT